MNNKTILLVRPPMKFLPNRTIDMIDLPLGLLYIGSSLSRHGYTVQLIDGVMPADECKRAHFTPSENYFGISFANMRRRVEPIDFNIACISAQYTVQFPNAIKMAELIKQINPTFTVLIGGAHVSVLHREIISRYRCFDIAVRGEGEQVVLDLIEALQGGRNLKKIRGISYSEGDKIISTLDREPIKNLDDLLFPAYELVDMERYFNLNKSFSSRTAYTFPRWERGVSLITSRGCPYKCNFCSIHLHMGRMWRCHSVRYVLKHMEYLIKTYGITYFHFEDDNLTANPERFGKILDGILAKGWNIKWDTPNGVRADSLSIDLLKKCRQSGCAFLIFGIESGVQRVLDKIIGKKAKIKDIERAAWFAKKAGVNTRAFYLIGNPGETREEIRATSRHALRMIRKFDCFGGIGMVVPLYGTKLFDECIRHDYLVKELTSENVAGAYTQNGIVKTPEFDPAFLKDVIDEYGRKTQILIKWLFIKRILSHIRLFLYCIKTVLMQPSSQWGSVYYKVIFFNHVLLWDLKHRHHIV
jgi:anaerobic magnesium-protoporphyrin IX monomethyl ester cyclase